MIHQLKPNSIKVDRIEVKTIQVTRLYYGHVVFPSNVKNNKSTCTTKCSWDSYLLFFLESSKEIDKDLCHIYVASIPNVLTDTNNLYIDNVQTSMKRKEQITRESNCNWLEFDYWALYRLCWSLRIYRGFIGDWQEFSFGVVLLGSDD